MTIRRTAAFMGAMLGSASVFACSSDPNSTSSQADVAGGSAGAASSSAGTTSNAAGAAASAGGVGGVPTNGSAGSVSAGGGGATSTSGGASATGGSGGSASGACSGNATYKITVNVTWPATGLDGPHYTTIIGGVHSGAVSLWKVGGLATEGVKEMAEMGGTTVFASEVNTAIAAHTAKAVIQFGGGSAPGTSIGMVEVSSDFPLVSFGSMLAPTPDWFVGVSSLSLCEAGAWLNTKTLDAVVYDAGTKDGADFDYGYPETQPPVAIGYSVKFPNMASAGMITFEKQ